MCRSAAEGTLVPLSCTSRIPFPAAFKPEFTAPYSSQSRWFPHWETFGTHSTPPSTLAVCNPCRAALSLLSISAWLPASTSWFINRSKVSGHYGLLGNANTQEQSVFLWSCCVEQPGFSIIFVPACCISNAQVADICINQTTTNKLQTSLQHANQQGKCTLFC